MDFLEPEPDEPSKLARLQRSLSRKVKGSRNRAKARTRLANVGFGELRRQLDYKCRWYGSRLLAVNPAHTSQQCSWCGYVAADKHRSQAVFRCLSCGHAAQADANAASNILAGGTAEGSSVAVCGVMPSGGR